MAGAFANTLFDGYDLRGVLGAGGYATVYRAWDPRSGHEVALKLLQPHLSLRDDIRARFAAEARLLAQARHPHIIPVFAVGEANGQPYFTMPIVEGETLSARLRAGPLPFAESCAILGALCSALDYLHGQRIIHRDVKASNVMLGNGQVLLMDLGVARALDASQGTGVGVGLGSPETMSPEQIRGEPAGPAADIYALGVVAYQMLCGHLPFAGDVAYVLHAHAHEPPPPPDGPNVPPSAAAAVLRALAKQPGDRPPTAAAFFAQFAASAAQGAAMQEYNQNRDSLPPTMVIGGTPPPDYGGYSVTATSTTPALIVYVLDVSGSMQDTLDGRRRIDVVSEALTSALRQMIFRSTKGSRMSPRYKVAMFAYSEHVYDLLDGVKTIDQVAHLGVPDLSPMQTTEAAKAFTAVEQLLLSQLPYLQGCPAPLVCHMTDGEFSGPDPEPVVQRIRALRVPDGNVLVENIFVSPHVVSGISDPAQWTGITPSTPLGNGYARKLQSMSSPLPPSYRLMLQESGYNLAPDALMLLPGQSPELVAMGFQMSAATPVR